MRLVSAVLGFALKKVGVLTAMVLFLFLSYLVVQALVPTLREAVADRDRLQRVTQEREALEDDLQQLSRAAEKSQGKELVSLRGKIGAEIREGRREVAQKKADVERRRNDQQEVCGLVRRIISKVLPHDACDAAEAAVEKAEEALATIEGNVARARKDAATLADPSLSGQQKLERLGRDGDSPTARAISNKKSELAQKKAEENSLQQAQASGVGWVLNQWSKAWRWLAFIAVLALVLPSLLRIVSYFLLMPLVSRMHRPIHLAAGAEAPAADLRTAAAERTLTVVLADGEVLSARSEHVRPVKGKVRSQLLYDWASPFISFASGLNGLTRVIGDSHGTSATLSTPNDPDSYLMRIDFTDHPGW